MMDSDDRHDKIEEAMRLAREKREDLSDEMEIRLKELEERASGFKQIREQKLADTRKEIVSAQESGRGLATGLSVAYTLMGVPLLGFGLGWLVDKYLVGQGSLWSGLLTILFAAIAIGMVVMTTNRMDRDKTP